MKAINYFSTIFLMVGLYLPASSQTASPNISDYAKMAEILPPSPNAASLGKFGGINVGLSSGMANVNVPVCELVSNNLTIPISIAYSTGGFKVDELPGRVGTGWSFNAGGVISRTVYGTVDESSPHIAVPSDFPARSRNLINFMEALSYKDPFSTDAQPDIFSFNFNGYSGRFILDANLNPLQLMHSNLKIERDFASTIWNYKITTPDGVQYFFGGQTATEKSKTIQAGADCGRHNTTFVPTAWYLNKIVHPNNDTITFTYSAQGMTYSASTSETIYYRKELDDLSIYCSAFIVSPPTLNNNQCENILQLNGVILDEINSTGGSKVKLKYITRSDCDDKLLSSIELYAPSETNPYRLYSFDYQYGTAVNFKNAYSNGNAKLNYRPFLSAFTEKSTDLSLSKGYTFTYNDINNLPPRLSYAQDHYGFFNGANNLTLIPVPSSLSWKQKFPMATANREINSTYCQKGLLSVIKYPTGGTDSLFYEANQVYQTQVPSYPAQTTQVSASAYNLSYLTGGTTVFSSPVVISFQQEVLLTGNCISNSTTGGDPLHDQTTVTILDENNTIIQNYFMVPGNNLNKVIVLYAGHTYRIKANSNGDKVSGGVSFMCAVGNITYQDMNVTAGGMRMLRVKTNDGLTTVSNIKKYLYSSLLTPAVSSASRIYSVPAYEKYLNVYVPCMSGLVIDPDNPAGQLECGSGVFGYSSMYSNTLNNLYMYPGTPVSYGSVIESLGENYENGGIEHQFTINSDLAAYPIVGGGIFMGAPMSNYSWKNGRELYQHVFKKQGTSYLPVKKTFTHYKEDTRVDQEIKAYMCNKKYSPYCQNTPPSDDEINAYDLVTYSFFRKWVYPDTVTTWTYDQDGLKYVSESTVTEYANVTHAQPTKVATNASDKASTFNKTLFNYYPADITLSGTEETARQTLISKYMIGTLIQQKVNKGSGQITVKTGYNVFPNGLVLPYTKNTQVFSNAIEERGRINAYNTYGKILEQAKANDVLQSYVWSNLSNYPLAQVVNGSNSGIAFTSFEKEGAGGWTFTGSPVTDALAPTGKYVYSLPTGGISKTGLTTGTYIVSYWSKNANGGSQTVNATTGVVGKIKNGWSYYEHTIVNPASGTISVSGSGVIDELRLYPLKAQMISYTYEPFIGVSSQCDINNVITYYEYDGLGRLVLTRDQDRNIIKKICYNYTGQAENCTTTIADWQNTTTAIRCKKNGSNQNTGEQEQEQKDINVFSPTYNQLRWVVVGTNLTACPITLTIYAKIEYTDWFYDIDRSYATAWIKFYSDAAGTAPISVSSLSVNYKKDKIVCGGGVTTTNYTLSCSGTQVSLGSQLMSLDDGVHCYSYQFQTTGGSGYTQN
jgi:hypothetical protein